ncbi:unnamed protein product [Closterium sp. NIES-53]
MQPSPRASRPGKTLGSWTVALHCTAPTFSPPLLTSYFFLPHTSALDVSYAKYANLPAEFALRTSFIPPLLYAIQGSSKHLVIAPVSVVSQLLGTSLSAIVDPTTDPALYTSLAVTATFFCGLFQLIMGLCRHRHLLLRPLPTHHGALPVRGRVCECQRAGLAGRGLPLSWRSTPALQSPPPSSAASSNSSLGSAGKLWGLPLLVLVCWTCVTGLVSQLPGTSLSALVNPATDLALYTSLAVTATFFCGLFQLIMGLCR